MRRWSVFVMLIVAVLALLVAGELLAGQPTGETEIMKVRLSTHTPTVTRTAGWWNAVATWTPTATGAVSGVEATEAGHATPTPELNLPPVKTLARPSPYPTWTRRP